MFFFIFIAVISLENSAGSIFVCNINTRTFISFCRSSCIPFISLLLTRFIAISFPLLVSFSFYLKNSGKYRQNQSWPSSTHRRQCFLKPCACALAHRLQNQCIKEIEMPQIIKLKKKHCHDFEKIKIVQIVMIYICILNGVA